MRSTPTRDAREAVDASTRGRDSPPRRARRETRGMRDDDGGGRRGATSCSAVASRYARAAFIY